MRPFCNLCVAALAALLASEAWPAPAGVTVVDDTGAQLTLPHTAQRIVSLAPGSTEMLFAAGAGAHVVATVEYSVEPAAARAVPRIGDSNAIDLERLVLLHPDVVVVWPGGNNSAQIARVEALGLPLYRQRTRHVADLAPAVRRLGALAGTQAEADRAAHALETELAELAGRYAHARSVSVLLEVWNRPVYTIGGEQLLSDVLQLCGAHNIYADLTAPGPAVTVESVIERNPELIVAVAPDAPTGESWLNEWRTFPGLRAVAAGHLQVFDDQRLSRLGPSVLPAARSLCALIDRAR